MMIQETRINDELIFEEFETPVLMWGNIKTTNGKHVAAIYNNETAKEKLKNIYEQLKACNGQSLSNIELATAHKDACINWETSMMELVGEDAVEPVKIEIQSMKSMIKVYKNIFSQIREIFNMNDSQNILNEIKRLQRRNNDLEEAIRKVNRAFPKAFELNEEQTAALALANKTMHKTS